jgi:hypothetical protein
MIPWLIFAVVVVPLAVAGFVTTARPRREAGEGRRADRALTLVKAADGTSERLSPPAGLEPIHAPT